MIYSLIFFIFGFLIALFAIRRYGTGVVGMAFGPVCVLWFVSLGAVGIWHIAREPAILRAIDPTYALHFLTAHGYASFLVLGSVLHSSVRSSDSGTRSTMVRRRSVRSATESCSTS